MVLFNVNIPFSRTSLFWEHALKSAFGFIGTYVLILFGPTILAGKHKGILTEIAASGFDLAAEEPLTVVMLSTVATVFYNYFIWHKNAQFVRIEKVALLEDKTLLEFTLTNFNSPQRRIIQVPTKEVTLVKKKPFSFNNGKIVYTFEGANQQTLCGFDTLTSHFHNNKRAIYKLLKELSNVITVKGEL